MIGMLWGIFSAGIQYKNRILLMQPRFDDYSFMGWEIATWIRPGFTTERSGGLSSQTRQARGGVHRPQQLDTSGHQTGPDRKTRQQTNQS